MRDLDDRKHDSGEIDHAMRTRGAGGVGGTGGRLGWVFAAATLAAVLVLIAIGVAGVVSDQSHLGGGAPPSLPSVPSASPEAAEVELADVSLVHVRTGRASPLPVGMRSVSRADYFEASPDGSMMAFQGAGYDAVPRSQIFVADLDGTGARQVTHEWLGAWSPRWSPDGTEIVYLTPTESGVGIPKVTIYVVDVATGETTRILRRDGHIWQPGFSPDGRTILFTMARERSGASWAAGLWTVPVSGGAGRRLLRHAAYGSFSPDGTTIAFHRTPRPSYGSYCGPCFAAELDVTLAEARRGDPERARSGSLSTADALGWGVRWSPDGERIVYTRRDVNTAPRKPGRVIVLDVASGERTTIGAGWGTTWIDDQTLVVSLYEGAA